MIDISKELEETKTEMLNIIENALEKIQDEPELIIRCIEDKNSYEKEIYIQKLNRLALELVTYKVVENNFKTM